jgi:hypothetical protein
VHARQVPYQWATPQPIISLAPSQCPGPETLATSVSTTAEVQTLLSGHGVLRSTPSVTMSKSQYRAIWGRPNDLFGSHPIWLLLCIWCYWSYHFFVTVYCCGFPNICLSCTYIYIYVYIHLYMYTSMYNTPLHTPHTHTHTHTRWLEGILPFSILQKYFPFSCVILIFVGGMGQEVSVFG